jgi:peptidoglycan/xylan/chitin deacetylase (PgdA/CDA1 family)
MFPRVETRHTPRLMKKCLISPCSTLPRRFWQAFLVLPVWLWLAPAHAASSAPVFVYYQIGADQEPADNLRIEQFEAQLEMLKEEDYVVWPVAEIVQGLKDHKPLPEHAVGLTFDDAYRSVADNALPRLQAARMTATIFVSPKLVDRGGGYMSWDELRRASREGFAIGAKILMDDVDDSDSVHMLAAVNESLTRIRDEIGTAPTLFAYEDGIAEQPVRDIVASRGFIGAFGLQSGPVHGDSQFYLLPRFPMTEAFGTLDRFRTAANSLPLPITDLLPEDGSVVVGENPPQIGFTVRGNDADLTKLACFIEDQGKAALEVIGQRVEIRPAQPFDEDDTTRVNCTVPGSGANAGRWHWLGFNFYVPERRDGP